MKSGDARSVWGSAANLPAAACVAVIYCRMFFAERSEKQNPEKQGT